jgi:hypothetical protein
MKVEKGYSAAVHQELADLGHNVVVPQPVSVARRRSACMNMACWRVDRTRARMAVPSVIEGAAIPLADQLSWYSRG